jgi:hypothetical protein
MLCGPASWLSIYKALLLAYGFKFSAAVSIATEVAAASEASAETSALVVASATASVCSACLILVVLLVLVSVIMVGYSVELLCFLCSDGVKRTARIDYLSYWQ